MLKPDSQRNVAVSGWYACLSLFERRPDDIRQIFITKRKTKLLGHVLKWAASKRLPYNVVEEKELEKISGTKHNEGIVLLSEEKAILSEKELIAGDFSNERLMLVLDNVANPQNLGAILRTTAFFGVESLILTGNESPRRISPAIMRISQGGIEEVKVFRTEDPVPAFGKLKNKGYTIIGTDVFGKPVTGKISKSGPLVLIMGGERGGMRPKVRDLCDKLVKIPGSGKVESLNVSVACGVFLALFAGAGKD